MIELSDSALSIHGVLERNARKYPVKEAFISATGRLTYSEMNEAANRMARSFQEIGIRQGDRIAILSRNNENFFFAYFSLLKIGAILMPISTRLTPKEIAVILRNSNATGILYEKELTNTVHDLSELFQMPHTLCIQDSLLSSASFSSENINLKIDSTDMAEILFTSGTTGIPKGVLFNHERVLAVASAISAEFQLSSEDKVLTLMPLSHSAPLNAFFVSGLYCGCSHVLGDYTPQSFLQWIHKEKTTFTFAAPVAYLLATKEPNRSEYDLSSMKVFAYGGGPLALASYQHVRDVFQNHNFYQVYGLTEAGPNGSLLRPEEHLSKAGSIGKHPVVTMELRVVRADGNDTAPGEYGEIIMAGNSLMVGYDNNPEETSDAVRDGWLYTGDIAYRDEDGYVYIVDRKKDVIISGGVNIYPREIEEVLAKHPAILESCVVGVPNDEWGETVKAVVVLKGDVLEVELREFVADYLADYKRPRIYNFVKELPRNASGKILKQEVKMM